MKRLTGMFGFLMVLCMVLGIALGAVASGGTGSGGTGGGGGNVETIKVIKCYYVSGNGTMLVSAGSSNPTARLYVGLAPGVAVEIQNGGGGRYGGSVFYVGHDPVTVTIFSSTGASVVVNTAPFQF